MKRGAYIERGNDGFEVVGTSVPLDSIVSRFNAGESPETIRRSLPPLTLEQVYGAIAFYIAHKQEVDSNVLAGNE